LGEKCDASLIAGETIQMGAAVVHILLKPDHFLESWLLGLFPSNGGNCFFPNVVADDVEV
jgi:hypothetical protein